MAKLYTKQGDDGHTVLFDGTPVSKTHERVETYGTIDELNAVLGLASSYLPQTPGDAITAALRTRLTHIQGELFVIGAELATPPDTDRHKAIAHIAAGQVAALESWIDEASNATPLLRTFILPGGCTAAAQLHVARTVCRRAERLVVALGETNTGNPDILIYLNRLGDLLFAWARLANQIARVEDTPWQP